MGCPAGNPACKPPGMDGTAHNARRSALRGLALAAALMLPASASGPAFADTGAEFKASFAPLNAAAAAFVPSAGMVDVTAIDPADELAPATGIADSGRSIGGGVASYYGNELAGHRTASGERFDPGQLTAAHRTLPLGTKVRVTNPANGKSVVVRINDRGPFARGRVLDLSKSAASEIGLVARGSGRVELAVLD
jgi:rare lipoprotein A